MAQYSYKPPSYFDTHWKPRIEFIAGFLRDTQSRWLLSDSAFPACTVASVILHIFAFDFHASDFLGYRGITPDEMAARSFDDWCEVVRSPIGECAALLPLRESKDHALIAHAFESILERAAESWASNPGEPPPAAVALECAQFLSDRRFLKLYA